MTGMTRREMLAAGTALAVNGLAGKAAAQTAPATGLNALAAAKGMRFGSCFAWAPAGADRGSFANPAYAALLERDCGVLVPENEFKWQALRPDATTFNFDRFSDMLDYAEAKGMAMRGHTLFWHKTERMPRWLNDYDFGADPPKSARTVLGQHIRTAGKYFGDHIYSFDVVNETVSEQGALRESALSRAFGGTEAMLDFAFHTARTAAPKSQLVYNDYMSWEPGNDAFRTGVLRMLEGFKKRGVPCDALGLQSHIGIRSNDSVKSLVAGQERAWRGFLDEVTGMGYQLLITEFDVNDRGLPADIEKRDRAVADYAKAYLDICFSYTQLKDVLAWGMCDKYSWLQGFSPRGDKQPMRPVLYDAGFKPKPLYAAFENAFKAAPGR
ncbi:endo-1,4-beta-xylanase [Sphingomonas sp. LB-2]|uniref:endo-1,4-beta-xylanase n=1 Tax=Sphingomonas caeni TaxID=2984949 RepID=UPI002231C86C|nr:endo-1,4-beta-xylanase [Sphingomonas caeni]MCW3847419.1 endo-1,4-beta-xylanase [Sphingomonas caeni]